MDRAFYSATSAMITSEAGVKNISNNIANANTVGYKTQAVVNESFNEVLFKNYDNKINDQNFEQVLGTMPLGTSIGGIHTNYDQGNMVSTYNPYDFALLGSGFFTVERDGEYYYTRDGEFRVDNEGYLVTSSGDRVQGRDLATGNMGPIYVGDADISVTALGDIELNGEATYQFVISDFDEEGYNALERYADNLYVAPGANPVQGNALVNQGALEGSNVDIVDEYANLIITNRHYESNNAVLRYIDNINGMAVSQLGKV